MSDEKVTIKFLEEKLKESDEIIQEFYRYIALMEGGKKRPQTEERGVV